MAENKMTFEKAIARLEEITAKIEDTATSIEESVELYKEATELIKYCTETIDEAQLQVNSVIGGDDDIGRGSAVGDVQ